MEDLPSYDHLFGATQHDRPPYIEKHDTQGISEPPIGHAPIESAGGFDPRDSLAAQEAPPRSPGRHLPPTPSTPSPRRATPSTPGSPVPASDPSRRPPPLRLPPRHSRLPCRAA